MSCRAKVQNREESGTGGGWRETGTERGRRERKGRRQAQRTVVGPLFMPGADDPLTPHSAGGWRAQHSSGSDSAFLDPLQTTEPQYFAPPPLLVSSACELVAECVCVCVDQSLWS